ncbi:hypothetical protein ACHAWF_009422 [Thalassiosira exigua]
MTTTLRRPPSLAATTSVTDDDRAPTTASSSGSDLLDFIQADVLASRSSGGRMGGRNVAGLQRRRPPQKRRLRRRRRRGGRIDDGAQTPGRSLIDPGNNPYAGHSSEGPSGGRSVGSFASSRRLNDAPSTWIAAWYLNLPFRFRYFLQLFAILGVFMLALLNYFIAMEGDVGSNVAATRGGAASKLKPSTYGIEGYVQEGGGASPNVVPKLRVRNPFRFLHRDPQLNGLLDLAVAMFRAIGRFGGGDEQRRPQKAGYTGGDRRGIQRQGGCGDPFALGWRSMPRQIHRDFATGLSDDARTIEHSGKGKQGLADAMGRDAEGEGDRRPSRGTIAYVLPVTSCYPDDGGGTGGGGERSGESSPGAPRTEAAFRDVALLLRATIHARSSRNPASESQYDYRMHAFVHPRAKKCRSAAEGDGDAGELFAPRPPGDRGEGTGLLDGREGGIVDRSVVLQNLGYKVAVRYPPLTTKDVRSDVLRKHLEERPGDPLADLIRLYAYELEEYDAVALVDYDTLVLGPVDGAADLIVNGGTGSSGGEGDDGGGGVDAVFSWERVPSFADPQALANVINLSFLLVRPSRSTFRTLVEGYETAKFSEARGFGSLGRGPHPGWTTSRGYLTYYYDEVAGRGSRMEVGRCAYGHPGDEEDVGEKRTALILSGMRVECGGGGADGAGAAPARGDDPCATCAASKAEEVIVADLSRCRAPWTCGAEDAAGEGGGDSPATADVLSPGPCQKFRNAWFRGRLQMEDVHPQLEKGREELCVEGRYRPMKLLKPSVAYKPGFLS